MNFFEAEGQGLLIYLRQEGRGIGLFSKVLAYTLHNGGTDIVDVNEHRCVPVDARTYGLAAEVIRFLGIKSIRLLTSNPAKTGALQEWGIEITESVPIHVAANSFSERCLETNKLKLSQIA